MRYRQILEACWKGYHREGNKKMFGKTYPNCVKNKAKNESTLTEFDPGEGNYGPFQIYIGNYATGKQFATESEALDEIEFLMRADPKSANDEWKIKDALDQTVWEHDPGAAADDARRQQRRPIQFNKKPPDDAVAEAGRVARKSGQPANSKKQSESVVNEFAADPDGEDDNDVPDRILILANRWWNAGDKQPQIANVLRSLGWSIAQVESEDDAVQLMHNDGTTYFISADDFDPEVFESGVAEGAPISGDGGAVANFKQQMANNTELAYQKAQQGVAEEQLNELDLFAPVTTFIKMTNGSYVQADWRRSQGNPGLSDSASFINFKTVNPNVAKQLGLDSYQRNKSISNYKSGTIAHGGAYQGSGPLSTRGYEVVDYNKPETMEDLPPEIKPALIQWVQKQGVAEGSRVARKAGQPANSKKHSDLYTDENPRGTITGLKFATVTDARASVTKIRNSGRSHAHKIQAAVAMEQRARAAGKASAAAVYRRYINANKKTNEDQPLAEKCWDGYAQQGTKNKGGRQVPNCVAMTEQELEEDLKQWFKQKWVRFGPDGKIRGACARGKSSEGKSKCLPKAKAQALGQKGRAKAGARKRRQDPDANRSGRAINVKTKEDASATGALLTFESGSVKNCDRTLSAVCQCDSVNNIMESQETLTAICVLSHSDRVQGTILLKQKPGSPTFIVGEITGLQPGQHGFHIHEFGDLSRGCESAGAHYNPYNVTHGDLRQGHVGDLGNIVADKFGRADFAIVAERVNLTGDHSVVGRAIVVHSKQDDLGQGGNAESLKSGNAGDRLACGVITLKKTVTEARSATQQSAIAIGMKQAGVKPALKENLPPVQAIPAKSIIQGYTVFFDQPTMTISVTRGGVNSDAAIEQERISVPSMEAYYRAVYRMINRIDDEIEPIIKEGIPFDQCPGCGGPIVHVTMLREKQDACYHKVKSRYKVWPSAYASGALVQCRKKGAANWGNSKE